LLYISLLRSLCIPVAFRVSRPVWSSWAAAGWVACYMGWPSAQANLPEIAMFIVGLALGVLLGMTLALCVFSLLLWTLQDQGTRKEHL